MKKRGRRRAGKALRYIRGERGRDFLKKYVVDEDLSKLEPAAAAAWERRARN